MNKAQLKKDIFGANIPNLMVSHLAGSHAYGMNTPESDIDVRGVFCGSQESVCTPFYPHKEQTIPEMEDAKVYELSNFLKLYTQCNPNILETLWVDDDSIITDSNAYSYMRQYREELLSKKLAFTFSGYAISQLKRIKGHNKWINNPQPIEAPKHKDYIKMIKNFTDSKIMPRDFNITDWYRRGLVHCGNDIFIITGDKESPRVFTSKQEFNISSRQSDEINHKANPLFLIKYCAEEFKRAKENHTNYWTWKNNRNKKRSALEEDFGYDTKHASHLVRLLRMGEEALKGQGIIVKRPDAKDLLDIRAGLWDYDDLVKWAEEKDDYIRGELYEKSTLPKSPDIKTASKLLLTLQEGIWQ